MTGRSVTYIIKPCRSEHRAKGMVRGHLQRAGLDPDDCGFAHFAGTPVDPMVKVHVFGDDATHDSLAQRFTAEPALVPTGVNAWFGNGHGRFACHAHPTVCCLLDIYDGMYLGDHSETCRITQLGRPVPALSAARLNDMLENLRITL